MSEKGKKLKAGSSNFGAKGWFIVLISVVYFYLSTAVTSDGLNVIQNYLMGQFGVGMSALAIYATVGGWLTLITIPLFTKIANAKGVKTTIIVSLAIFIVSVYFVYNASSVVVYGIAMAIACMTVVGFGMVGTGILGANWFPTKKGLYMGWATFGIPIAAATVSIMQQSMIETVGFANICWVPMGIALFALIVTALFVKNNPEEAGAFPDNDQSMTPEQAKAIFEKAEAMKKNSPWTVKKILTYKYTWFIALGWGLFMMGAQGLISQFVAAGVSWGHDVSYPVMLLSVMFPVGLFASWFTGYVDDKWGVKVATEFICVLQLVGILLCAFFGSNPIALAVGGGCFMSSMSGGNNLTMSVTGSKFGRFDFSNAWAVVSVLTRVLSTSGMLVVALLADNFGYTTTYLVIAVTVVIAAIIVWMTDVSCVGRTVEDFEKTE